MSLSDKLEKIAGQRAIKAKIGIIDSMTYPDGELVAQVGYWNEYGYQGTIPARTATVYHSVNEKTGDLNKGGKFVKKSKANLAREVVIPAYELDLPARSFFRTAIENNRDKLGPMLIRLMEKHDTETAIRMMCEHMVDELKTSVLTWTDPPNAPSTIKKKGYDAPLRGPDKLLRNSFSYEINQDD